MDCRNTQTLLAAFHDGELPAADRARVEDHLRGCRECGMLLADLTRADQAAGVPDPGPAYWDRFNARVMDRVEREADGPEVAILRPGRGWMRRQLRYLIPAAAVAALVVAVVRFEGTPPISEPRPAATKAETPSAASPAPGTIPSEERLAAGVRREATGSGAPADGQGWQSTGAGRDTADLGAPADGQGRPGAGAGGDATGSGAPAIGAPSPPVAFRGAPTGSPPHAPAADGAQQEMRAERKEAERPIAKMAERQEAAKARSASGMAAKASGDVGQGRPGAGDRRDATGSVAPASPCEQARNLAERERFREAEAAQRACLAGDLDASSREKGLVFLAELLDRQARFADADTVIAEIRRDFPASLPLDLYLRRRPMVQKRQE